MRLIASIVLYQPDVETLARTLASLAASARKAMEANLLKSAVVRLGDNSLNPLDAFLLEEWRSLLEEMGPVGLEYEHIGQNLGFGRAHNRIFSRCKDTDDLFLVANPDLVFQENSLCSGVTFLLQHPSKGVVVPSLSNGRSDWRPACFRYPDLATLFARAIAPGLFGERMRRYECRDWLADTASRNPAVASGCCMLFRTSEYVALCGFDERFFLYFEDFDLSYRASRRSQLAYCSKMQVVHLGGGAARKGWRHVVLFCRSGYVFFSTHGWRWF